MLRPSWRYKEWGWPTNPQPSDDNWLFTFYNYAASKLKMMKHIWMMVTKKLPVILIDFNDDDAEEEKQALKNGSTEV